MTVAEIHQVAIGFASLLATIAIPIVLAVIEHMRTERERQNQLKIDANLFVQANIDEIDYLPLCIIANAVSPHAHNERKIYNSFNSCPKEVQLEILKTYNIPIGLIKDKEVLDECIRSFDKQSLELKLNLPNNSLLHDNAKYLHAAIKYYRGMRLPNDINPSIFEASTKNIMFAFKPNQTFDLANYIIDYLDSDETMKSPFDVIEEKCGIEGLGDPKGCFWLMRFILSSCIAFKHCGLVPGVDEDWKDVSNINTQILETYEDMYYYTLLMLFTTYGSLNDTKIGK